MPAPSPASLEDRALVTLRASGGQRSLSALAADVFRASPGEGASAVLRALLGRDGRFVLAGQSVTLATAKDPPDLSPEPLETLRVAVLDFETTGWGRNDRAIEVGVVCFEGGREVASFGSLLDPGAPVSPFVTALTGISPQDLRGKPSFAAVWPEVSGLMEGRVLCAHNLPFDEGVLRGELGRMEGCAGHAPAGRLCTLRLARRLVPKGEGRSLTALCERFGLGVETHHRALDDARAAGRLLYRLVELTRESRPLASFGQLCDFMGCGRGRT